MHIVFKKMWLTLLPFIILSCNTLTEESHELTMTITNPIQKLIVQSEITLIPLVSFDGTLVDNSNNNLMLRYFSDSPTIAYVHPQTGQIKGMASGKMKILITASYLHKNKLYEVKQCLTITIEDPPALSEETGTLQMQNTPAEIEVYSQTEKPVMPNDSTPMPEDKKDIPSRILTFAIVLLNHHLDMHIAETKKLIPQILLDNQEVTSLATIQYRSSNPDIVKVSPSGFITAEQEGDVQVTIQASIEQQGIHYAEEKVIRIQTKYALNDKTRHRFYEQYIHRTIDKAVLEAKINQRQDTGKGAIWMVGVSTVSHGEMVNIDHRYYGKNSNNILMNWFEGSVMMVGKMSAPIPLIVPTHKFQGLAYGPNPEDPAIIYRPTPQNAQNITIDYQALLNNRQNRNGVGSLYNANVWNRKKGDKVDLVIYIFLMKEDIDWYTKKASPYIPFLIPDGEGLTVDQIIPLTHLDLILELQRFPVVLK